MIKKFMEMIYGREYELRERIFRMIILIGSAIIIFGIAEVLMVNNVLEVFIPMLILLAVLIVDLIITFKYRKIDVAAVIVALLIILIVFPEMFLLSGGLMGGATVWFALGFIYVFTMFSGKRLAFFMILSVVVDVFTYYYGYHNPDRIIPMESTLAAYLDSLFAVLAVGICGGAIIKAQIKMFEVERAVARRQQEELERVNRSRNSFFASMSHEIRTPINTIVGLNEMILRESSEYEIKEYAQSIQSASRMLLNLVNDVLDISQMETGRMEIIPVEYNTADLFGNLVDMVRVRMMEKKLEFFIDIDENLPSVILGDMKRVAQVLLNVLTNAVKYTNEGSVTFTAGIESMDGDDISLKISVEDTGIGIRKEELQHIYDYFKRVDTRKNMKIEGSGLGLYITKQLVDMMDGEIMVDSIYTKGSVFTIILPQKIVDATPVGDVKLLSGRANFEDYHPKFEAPEARILIVDDNHMNSLVESKLLKETKVNIDIAISGEECLEMTRRKYYHVILMDYMMPGMDGRETLKQLRRQENSLCRDSAVVVMSANSSAESGWNYLEEGFDGYLEKPIQGELLEAEILKFIPDDILEFRSVDNEEDIYEDSAKMISRQRKKRVRITTDCVSDLPEHYIEKYDIGMMYLYIRTPSGRFADTLEISSDNLIRYMTDTTSDAVADSVSMEEYEEFFADMLTQAEEVIHISMARDTGISHEVAVAAAQGFDHVHIIDSTQISGGQALVVLYAAKLAMDGYTVNEIHERVEMIKDHIYFRYILPSANIFYKQGYVNRVTAKICDIFGLHPVLKMNQSRIKAIGVRGGRLENSWKGFIRSSLRHKGRINTDIVFISHVGCSVEQQELIKREILKCVPFKQVIIQRASVSVSCNCGIGTFGLSYYVSVDDVL
ncbi:MAG: DegV family EDD domain-containing protein [Lachnospiraceae bacterium]|nr:DegV family EDD domain-containing protein [Lachnospiraceae bacterium]